MWWSFPSSRSLAMSSMPRPSTPATLRLAPIAVACAETGSLALVGAPVAGEAGRRHIALLAVDGSGASVAYRKTWLGGAEADWFAPGDGPAVLEVDGWRLGLAICKDTGVPQHASDTASLGIDVYVAGTCESAEDATRQDERARRIATDHDVWVAFASFAGPDGWRVHRDGRSLRDLVGGRCCRRPGRQRSPARWFGRRSPESAVEGSTVSRSSAPECRWLWRPARLPCAYAGVAEWQTQRT